MQNTLQILKGLHPGIILDRELKKRKLSKGRFALSINEYPQTLSAISKGKRDMNTALALRIEQALGLEEGYLMILQVYYDIEREKDKLREKTAPDTSKLRPVLFWDTSMNKIDWQKQKVAVIKRVFERGNKKEQSEIIRFYGKEVVESILSNKA